MEQLWEYGSKILNWALPLIFGLIAWFYKKLETQVQSNNERIDNLERRQNGLEMNTRVLEVKLDDVKEDIREIKRGVEKLIDRSDHAS